ncbi:hypothetical protein BGW80DRAFT_424309 [Lactifluus volemus]|nr:hypothetical protein BGW80DRAFT_424309 [Lactifluus volemus]
MVLTEVSGRLITTLTIKYADNIMKGFVTSLSIDFLFLTPLGFSVFVPWVPLSSALSLLLPRFTLNRTASQVQTVVFQELRKCQRARPKSCDVGGDICRVRGYRKRRNLKRFHDPEFIQHVCRP